MYALAEVVMFSYFNLRDTLYQFWMLQLFFIPVIGYFIYWWRKVLTDSRHASFYYSLRMNIVAASFTNMAFILLYLMNHPIN
jgi:1,4-dihydroxy-2-naphthoate octaprenyltransferase